MSTITSLQDEGCVLYAHNLPAHISYLDIEATFRKYNLIVAASLEYHEEPESLTALITFAFTAEAEKAFATIQLSYIPDVLPETRLILSKNLALGCGTALLHDLIRPFGPVEGLANISSVPYDHCKLICMNLTPEVQSSDLAKLFGQPGPGLLTSAEIDLDSDGLCSGRGFVKCTSPLAAFTAMQALDGALIGGKPVSISFQDVTNTQRGSYETITLELEKVSRERDFWMKLNVESERARCSEVQALEATVEEQKNVIQSGEDLANYLTTELEKNEKVELQAKELAEFWGKIAELQRQLYLEEDMRLREMNNSQKLSQDVKELKAIVKKLEENAQRRAIADLYKQDKQKAKRAEAEEKKAQQEARRVEEMRKKEERRKIREEEEMRREEERRKGEERQRAEEQKRFQEERRLESWRNATEAERHRCRERDTKDWCCGTGTWTQERAVHRFISLALNFETSNFSEERPLTFESVPWPTLHNPRQLRFQLIESSAIQVFLQKLQQIYRRRDTTAFEHLPLKKIQVIFHPDKWRSRNLFKSIEDDGERAAMESTVTAVSQAINAYATAA
ncbi:hypothetical protein H0H81_007963 [Sphagnurus paluster]|uniref:RRM domain-containing protein n=1 Tax=Sphagnurus paluster TaxID=117069 RepID=A0A9P7FSW5_9AGAR|nr:hypothetical protein H0H81_007963 [Sphagnurus paluster]